jgi:hypothetical protein
VIEATTPHIEPASERPAQYDGWRATARRDPTPPAVEPAFVTPRTAVGFRTNDDDGRSEMSRPRGHSPLHASTEPANAAVPPGLAGPGPQGISSAASVAPTPAPGTPSPMSSALAPATEPSLHGHDAPAVRGASPDLFTRTSYEPPPHPRANPSPERSVAPPRGTSASPEPILSARQISASAPDAAAPDAFAPGAFPPAPDALAERPFVSTQVGERPVHAAREAAAIEATPEPEARAESAESASPLRSLAALRRFIEADVPAPLPAESPRAAEPARRATAPSERTIRVSIDRIEIAAPPQPAPAEPPRRRPMPRMTLDRYGKRLS